MSESSIRVIASEELDAAFKSGAYDELIALCWECSVTQQNKPLVSIYLKKVLRSEEISTISVEPLRVAGDAARQEERWGEAKNIAAVGSIRFHGNRFFCLLLAEACFQLDQLDLVGPALAPLGEPASDDFVLLNTHASLAHAQANYAKAVRLFERLLVIEPKNSDVKVNYAATLFGLERWADAEDVLEGLLQTSDEPVDILFRLIRIYKKQCVDIDTKLRAIDAEYFSRLRTFSEAKAHSAICLFLGDFEEMAKGFEVALQFKNEPTIRFDLAEAQLASGDLDAGFLNYAERFEAFNALAYCESKLPRYQGQVLEDEKLFVWGEQGIGDEILFGFFFEELERRVNNVVVAMAPRLIPAYQRKFPSWTFLDRHDPTLSQTVADYVCPSGDLMILFTKELVSGGVRISTPFLKPDPNRYAEIKGYLERTNKKRICVSWRGGRGINGQIRSLKLAEFMQSAPAGDEWEFISMQFEEGLEEAVIQHGDRRVTFSGLDNKNDLEGVFALLTSCAAVVTIDNALAHFGAVLGVPTYVVIPAGQTQFRWKNKSLKNLLFPEVHLYVQESPGVWGGAMKSLWSDVIESQLD